MILFNFRMQCLRNGLKAYLEIQGATKNGVGVKQLPYKKRRVFNDPPDQYLSLKNNTELHLTADFLFYRNRNLKQRGQ